MIGYKLTLHLQLQLHLHLHLQLRARQQYICIRRYKNILDEVVMSDEEIKVKCFCEKVKDVTSRIHKLSGKVIKNFSYVIEVAKQ